MRHLKPRRAMLGISLVELMIAMVLGLMVLAALASLFANSSSARAEMERNSRQIENGRFAVELLADDLRMAGFYGELDVNGATTVPGAMPDPCSTDPTVWGAAMRIAVQGYDNAAVVPTCLPSDVKAGTDVLVVRRASTCEAGTTGCAAAVTGLPYLQVAKCSPENASSTTAYRLGPQGTTTFDRRIKDCAGVAGLRQYIVRIYYVSTDNGATPPVAVPTLKRLDFTGSAFTVTPLVEGIEELNIEYGIDSSGDGMPDDYSADPTSFTKAGCASCVELNNWMNVTTARISLLARNIEPSVNYTDTKTYTLGRDAAGADQTVTPGGAYRRHAYSGLVRLHNVAERREVPP